MRKIPAVGRWNMPGFLGAGLSGLLLTVSFPKFDLEWAAWFALVPLLYAVRDLRWSGGFRLGFICGLVHYLTLVYWLVHTMQTYGNLPIYLAAPLLFLLAAYLALFTGLFSATAASISSPALMAAVLPLLWVSLEYIRSFLFSGFPWELLGYAQFRNLHLIQISDIVGVFGISALTVLVNTAILIVLLQWKQRTWRGVPVSGRLAVIYTAVTLAFLGLAFGYGIHRKAEVDRRIAMAPKTRVAIVQGNISQDVKWKSAYKKSHTQKYIDLSLSAMSDRADLVVWPETAVPFYFQHDRALTDQVVRGIRQSGAHFLIGSPSFIRRGNDVDYYNSAFFIHPKGEVAGKYDKVHLVPYGEYVPLKQWLPFVGKIVEQVGDFKTGRMGEVLISEGHRLGVLICYEGIFPNLSAAMARNGARLLVNITNDAWYGATSAPYQHFSMAVFRAVENRRALIRSANTGISGFIDPTGRITATTRLFEDAVMTREVPQLDLQTVYSRYGDWFARLCLGLTLILIISHLYRRKRQ